MTQAGLLAVLGGADFTSGGFYASCEHHTWNGGMVERWNGGMVERWNGGMVEWWNGGMVERQSTPDVEPGSNLEGQAVLPLRCALFK